MPPSDQQGKNSISKDEFSLMLRHCLSMGFGEQPLDEAILGFAADIGYQTKDADDIMRLYYELLVLYMWLIVRACSKSIEDVAKRNACLDLFHRAVYEGHVKTESEGEYAGWYRGVGFKYLEYQTAVESPNEAGPAWSLSRVVSRNIFGEPNEDPSVQTRIGNMAFTFIGYVDDMLKELLDGHEIE